MTRRLCVAVAFLIVAALLSGCSINRATVTVDQTADLKVIKSIHVIKYSADTRGVNDLIANKLKTMGYTVTTGPDRMTDVDAIVTYSDKWIWDITMYMLELTVVIRDPKNDFPLASGSAFHTSMSRRSPEEMADEVFGNILSKQGGRS